mmetsp:Transcript_15961/g.24868  ORF Transcript_15961/g.24868 Transcript_15961/m.24868 type:complete len:114 (-) Transcript_15961:791-1132(-)
MNRFLGSPYSLDSPDGSALVKCILGCLAWISLRTLNSLILTLRNNQKQIPHSLSAPKIANRGSYRVNPEATESSDGLSALSMDFSKGEYCAILPGDIFPGERSPCIASDTLCA